ncbi:hypothetical protein AXF42_Ash010374 [Apostasia shenzhenica]|uniref:Uncharacterized protein n=1 Tax=Apostasia shenzhenica TaxID=1088818 RepID=A0A2I0BDT7_9ASPA|nr:hypothetical protein AXF42_Ash010374 [Apostasia shenzhenica]
MNSSGATASLFLAALLAAASVLPCTHAARDPNPNPSGDFFGNIPGLGGSGNGWGDFGGGYGGGYGGPSGGYARGGVIRPSVVCSDRGPCYKKRLTCPARCFTSYSRAGKGYGGGGGGGGCTIDCKKKCVAYC